MDDRDRARFIHDLYEFNDVTPAGNSYKLFQKNMDFGSPYFQQEPREKIVDLHGWILMDNHYHLILSEKKEGGLVLFMRKINIGYAKYFNERYKRSGTLFQGKTKKILLTREAHLQYILHYVHLNALDYLPEARNWRTGKIKNYHKALQHLERYRWSSYLDYCNISNFPSIITTGIFKRIHPDLKKETARYLRDMATERTDYSAFE